MSTLLHLIWRSLRGRILGWLRLMRRPKYFVGTLAGVVWMSLFALRPILGVARRNPADARLGEIITWLPAMETGAALLLLVGVSLWWIWPFGQATIALTETELHVLMPAPIRRRHIIQYALLRSQPGILFGCLMVSFLSVGGAPASVAWRFLSMWLFLTLWNLHARGRGLWVARLRELPTSSAWRRRAVMLAAVGLLWAMSAPGIASVAAALQPLDGDVAAHLRAVLAPDGLREQAPTLALLLAPARWIIGPFFAGLEPSATLATRLITLVWPVLLLGLHHEWVVRSQTQFEEASLARSRRQTASGDAGARFRAMKQSRRLSAPFRLRPTGPTEMAIVWKNLMRAHRTSLRLTVVAGAAAIGLAATVVSVTGLPDWLIGIMMIGGGVGLAMTPLMAGHQWRNDLRTDLLRIEVIRTWPIAGWRLFAAEVCPPACIATLYAGAAGGALLIAGVAAGRPTATGSVLVRPELATTLGVPYVALLLLGLATLLPLVAAIATLSATLQNLLALLWPSWIQLGLRRTGSAAHIGQGLLTGLGLAAAMAVGLLPGAVLVGGSLFVQIQMAEIPLVGWELPVLGVLAIMPLVCIIGLLIRFGGVLWDQLDPSAEVLGASGAP